MLEYRQFRTVNLADPFFDSLKSDYTEFSDWFERKADAYAYVFHSDAGQIDGFLYLKEEDGPLTDVHPPLPPAQRIKVGTLKINAHGTRLGERFLKKVFDHALYLHAEEIYVTIFEHHQGLLNLIRRYGFEPIAQKTTANGVELVLNRRLRAEYENPQRSYPLVPLGRATPYLISIQPRWHTRLLPDSILNNEGADVIEDVSHSNSIHKVYLAAMRGMEYLQPGDPLVIYRMTDNLGPAHYRSVATSVCVIEEYRSLNSFETWDEFYRYCSSYSVFTDVELQSFWTKKHFLISSASHIILHLSVELLVDQ